MENWRKNHNKGLRVVNHLAAIDDPVEAVAEANRLLNANFSLGTGEFLAVRPQEPGERNIDYQRVVDNALWSRNYKPFTALVVNGKATRLDCTKDKRFASFVRISLADWRYALRHTVNLQDDAAYREAANEFDC